MKTLRKILVLHVMMVAVFGVLYPLTVWGIARLFPEAGEGFPITRNGNLIGFRNIGQSFDSPRYFSGRPSVGNYDATAVGGSNMGPGDTAHLQTVRRRLERFIQRNPGILPGDVPADMVTASGSGLDPHISVQGAMVQVAAVAHNRNLDRERVEVLVRNHIEQPLFGLIGPERINVLLLNLALDSLSGRAGEHRR